MNRDTVRQIAVIVALAVTLLVNFLATWLPLNGQTSAEISNRIPLPVVPANYVFSIWGVIYTLLIGYAIYQALPANREKPVLRRIGYLFVLSCVANCTWLFLFHYEFFPLTIVAMGILLASLAAIYTRVNDGTPAQSRGEFWLVRVPFSVYMGWVTVATVVNAAYALADAGLNSLLLSGELWTVLLLVVATGITLTLIVTRRDAAYTAVIVWAFVGIAVKQSAIPLVAVPAAALAVVVAGALIVRYVNERRTSVPTLNAS